MVDPLAVMFGPCVRCGRYEHRPDCPSATPRVKPLPTSSGELPAIVRATIDSLTEYVRAEPRALLKHLDLQTAERLAHLLRAVLEMADNDAEQAVRNCASLDTNGYICEKSTALAAMKVARAMRGDT